MSCSSRVQAKPRNQKLKPSLQALMSSSIMSDGSSGVCANSYFNGYGYGFVCGCNLQVKVERLETSNTPKNPNRRYLRCPKSMGSQCKFFLWLDPNPNSEFVGEWWNMKKWFGECAKLRADSEASVRKIMELEDKHQHLKNVKRKMKKELLVLRILCCILLSVLLCNRIG